MLFGRSRRRGATPLKRKTPTAPGQWQATWGTPLRWLGVVLVLAGVGFGLWTGSRKLRDPNAFPLRQVHIAGELRNLAETDLQPVVSGYLGQNFFMANLDELRTALAANSWIEQIAVRRGWPDTIEIELQERVAFGYWGEREMVDRQGRRFTPVVVRQPGPWPMLAGPSGHELALIKAWQDIHALFDPLGLKLAKLTQDDRRAWWLTFDNGLEVYVGREHFEPRLRLLAQWYPRVLADQIGRIAVVDVRYGNGFAVRWKSGPPPAPTAG